MHGGRPRPRARTPCPARARRARPGACPTPYYQVIISNMYINIYIYIYISIYVYQYMYVNICISIYVYPIYVYQSMYILSMYVYPISPCPTPFLVICIDQLDCLRLLVFFLCYVLFSSCLPGLVQERAPRLFFVLIWFVFLLFRYLFNLFGIICIMMFIHMFVIVCFFCICPGACPMPCFSYVFASFLISY